MYAVVLIQFAIVSGLTATLLVTSSQVNYLKNMDLGFNKDQIIYFDNNSRTNYSAVITELETINGVKKATASQSAPGFAHSGMTLCRLGADKSQKFTSFEIEYRRIILILTA